MALDREDDYTRTLRDSAPSRAVDYYSTTTPYQVGADIRSTAGDIKTGVEGAIRRGNANAARFDAGMDAQFDRGPLMTAVRGFGDFWRGVTGGPETPASAVAPRQAPTTPVKSETIGQITDRVRASAPEVTDRYLPGTTATRAPAAQRTVESGMNGTLSTIGSQTDDWKKYLPVNRPEVAPVIQQVQVEQRPSAVQEYMSSSRYRENSNRGRAGRNQIAADLKGLEDVDAENGRNTRAAAELALRGQELNQRGALEVGRWGRDAQLQRERLDSETARDERRYQAEGDLAARRGQIDRENLDYRYQLDAPERDARIGRANLESQQLGIENADKQSALDLRTRAIAGDSNALGTLRALSGSKGSSPAEIMKDSIDMFASMTPGSEQHKAMARNLMMLGVLNPDGSLRTQRYAEGGAVEGALRPQVPQVNPLESMYRQYAMNTQAVGAIPVEFGQFLDLMQGSQGNPGNMGMGYANGGFVDTMAKGFRRTWRNWTGGDEQPPATAPVPPQGAVPTKQTPPAQETQQDVARRTFGGSLRAIDEMDRNGYAQGGAIDVSGHQVVGPGTGTSDSIPAVVDGQATAALSHGEFVWTNAATESAGAGNLKHIMQGLERGDPTIVAGVIGLAAKAAGSNAKAIQTRE